MSSAKKSEPTRVFLTCFLPTGLEDGRCVAVGNGKEASGGGDVSAMSFPLLRACLTLIESADSDVSTLAAECLILCTSNLNDDVAHYVIAKSNMCASVVHHLVKLYCAIPHTLKAADIRRSSEFVECRRCRFKQFVRPPSSGIWEAKASLLLQVARVYRHAG
ncbi:hypothetical protein HPB48_016230 [Haemaphysalis longicornis]|uniref:Uncharacterized protein n=1 Tax=Haemaphysalis longicornis TaxID=44386 RepID=A0A9J6GF36_HAELO|nr:hypothetical protein HPB48_016230 [Haemaphysalis longicornis]